MILTFFGILLKVLNSWSWRQCNLLEFQISTTLLLSTTQKTWIL